MSEDRRVQQEITRADRQPDSRLGSMFAHASNFTLVNPQFQTANIINNQINNYHSWNNNNVSAIRSWLKAPDPSINFVAACDKRTPGTGQWILSHPQYVQWCQGRPGILWIQGKVGSGKTILSTTIIKNLQVNSPLGCYYYYFDNRDNLKTKTTARGLLQSLLLQMATSSEGVHSALHAHFKECNDGLMEPTTEDLSKTLVAVAKDLSPIFLVLDAMDECTEANDVFKHLALIQDILCIAVTSRYLAETSYEVSENIHLDDAQDAFQEDVTKYLQDQLKHRKLKEELFNEIVNCLTQGSQGQFRWVDCQVTVLQRCKTPKAIQEALKKLPKTLEQTYTVAIERMNGSEHVHDANQLLMWLVYACEPLSIAEVGEILAVDLDVQMFDPDARSLELETGTYDILDSTLITVNAKQIVQLAHNSVKEFLTNNQGLKHSTGLIEINDQLAHSTICQTCLIYLLQFTSKQIYAFEKDYPLALYAAKYWPSHMRGLGKAVFNDKQAKDLALALVKDRSQLPYINWIRIYGPDRNRNTKCRPDLDPRYIHPPLYYMAYDGLTMIMEHLIVKEMADVNAQGGWYGNALQAAAAHGKKETVQLLVEHKTDVNARGGHYGNALQGAALNGYKDIVLLLLENNADVNAQGGQHGSALQAAALMGGKEVVQILLKHKANVNARGGIYGTALQAAIVSNADKDIVQLLLEHKADVNAQGGMFDNALQAAVVRGKRDFLLLLLEHKGDVNAKGQYGNTLQVASARGLKDMVLLLLEHKADINAQGGLYGNALQAAAAQGDKSTYKLTQEHAKTRRTTWYGNASRGADSEGMKEIFQILLDHKADVNAQGGLFGTALQAAAFQGNMDIAQLLLEHNADVNAQGGYYGCALQAAAAEGNNIIVRFLLKHKADVNVQGGKYGTALQAAAAHGNSDAVHLLLHQKADIYAQGGQYGNALLAAIQNKNKDIVQLLLEAKSSGNQQGGEYQLVEYTSALEAAVAKDDEGIVQLLLEHKGGRDLDSGRHGKALLMAVAHNTKNIVQLLLDCKADANTQHGWYGSALLAAVTWSNKDIVQLLLNHKADINQGGHYGNVLHIAVVQGKKDIVHLLLEHKADVNAQGGQYGNALQAAAAHGNKDIMQLLLEHKADVNAKNGYYGNALQAAAAEGSQDNVELLLSLKADVNAKGGQYGNSLQAAAAQGHKCIVKLLLEHKADINAQGGHYGNALQAAAAQGDMDIVHLLLQQKADISAQGGYYGNALQAAIQNANTDIVQLFLEGNSNINPQGGKDGVAKYTHALQVVVSRGSKGIAIMFLLYLLWDSLLA
ncbi:ankyrin repeat-containing domain protein [Rhodocollybia butyracea]|uniref:Ankyrin repeat-containing domain protein n=1 Tax=Rhodocollybia butyracea TaxID=206335 RepID=A0A9P5PGH2_9AGAR|nr:ankyrin repeat-containing domain protein [Rhodocollybia butyracea]